MKGLNRRTWNDESGFVMVQLALLLIPLMLFAAIATDVGAWYLRAQQAQRTADAAALAGVAHMPNLALAEEAAREVAARNGLVDTTPSNNDDFWASAAPQIEVTAPTDDSLDVAVRIEAPAFFGSLVTDGIDIERYSIAQNVRGVFLGNPTSGLGTGLIDEAKLGLPNDKMWLAVSAYCEDRENGDNFLVGFYGPYYANCGPDSSAYSWAIPNPTFEPDAYTFVVETQPGASTTDIDIYEPGLACRETGGTGDYSNGPALVVKLYGPNPTRNHSRYLSSASPFATIQTGSNDCIGNSPNGDGWWPMASNLASPGPEGGYYYVRVMTRHPGSYTADSADAYLYERFVNNFSLRATRTGENRLCAFSSADPTCPQVYGLNWLPIFREVPNTGSDFYLAEVSESYAGETMTIQFFDAAEGVDNIQFADSNNQAMPFRWRYADTSVGLTSGPEYRETAFVQHSKTCMWQGAGGQPCLDTSYRPDFNDHFIELEIDIPPDYECGTDCWWKVRYTSNGSNHDRSGWSVSVSGDPIRILE